jgi:non-specific serine/threonine protein kinase
VWWIEVAPTASETDLAHAVAQAIGLSEDPVQGSVAAIVDGLRHAEALLVFDNCERRFSDVATLFDNVTRTCRDVRVLATSRETLGANGETVMPVLPLDAPSPRDASIDSVLSSEGGALFVSRARVVDPGFEVRTTADARAVAEICATSFGVPLAIELAAGTCGELDIATAAADLAREVALLEPGQRERVLDAVIRWVYGRLGPDERILWERLSVFEGGFDSAAMAAVCSADEIQSAASISRLVHQLASRSLIAEEFAAEVTPDALIETRYRQLESLRHFARRRLVDAGEMANLQRRHAEYYLAFAEESRPLLRQEDQKRWLRRLEAEHDNLKKALSWWVREGDSASAMRLAGSLGRFWHMRGYWREGRALLREVLELPGAQEHDAARAMALIAKGHLAFVMSDFPEAMRYYEDALSLREALGNDRDIADSKHRVGIVAEVFGETSRAYSLQKDALRLARSAQSRELEADVLHHLGVLTGALDEQAAEEFLQQSLALRRSLKDSWGEAWSLVVLGNHYRAVGRSEHARIAYEESLSLYEAQRDRRRITSSLISLAGIDVVQARYVDARVRLTRATEIAVDLGDLRGLSETLESWAMLAAAERKASRCFTLLGAADALRASLNARRAPLAHRWLEETLAPLEAETVRFESLSWRTDGQRLKASDAVAFAIGEG